MADSGTLEPVKMAGREQLFADIASEFETQLDKALDETGLVGEERLILRNKYTTSFNQNIKFGIMKTFGQPTAVSQAPAAASDLLKKAEEISADDVESAQYAAIRTAHRRSTYPAKGKAILKKTLDINYKTLEALQTDVPTLPDVDTLPDISDPQHSASLETTSANIKECKSRVAESLEKAGRLVTAFNILDNNKE